MKPFSASPAVHSTIFSGAFFAATQLLAAIPAHAEFFSVNSTGDQADARRDGVCETAIGNQTCTLRAAIMESNAMVGADVINFRFGTTARAITLTAALPIIVDGVTIAGPGASLLSISGNRQFRVLEISSSGIVNLSGITITEGQSGFGSGIFNSSAVGTLNINNCFITNNNAGSLNDGGDGAGIVNNGILIIRGSAIKFNRAFAHPILNPPLGGRGGGLLNGGTVTIVDSDFDHNQAAYHGGGIRNGYGDVIIRNSTFRENGTFVRGGAIENFHGSLIVSNSTFYANYAHGIGIFTGSAGGALGSGGAIWSSNDGSHDPPQITNSTLTANYAAGAGGAIFGIEVANGTRGIIKSTIIAGNLGGSAGGPDLFGSFVSQGFNLIGKQEGSAGFTLGTDKKGTIAKPLNPKFDPKGLRSNGGPTLTIALTATSPAIDKGTSAALTGQLTTDQRGTGFFRTVNKAPANATGGDGTDIGAYELQ